MSYKAHTICRVCWSEDMTKYLDLGELPLSNNLCNNAYEVPNRYPLQVMLCNNCGLSQLSIVVDPEVMFSHYVYRSSINKPYVEHCRQMAKDLKEVYGLTKGSFHIDLAGNDCALLKEFRDEIGLKVLNVDPAKNLAEICCEKSIQTITAFWSEAIAEEILFNNGYADLITATNVFAHVDDVYDFMRGIQRILKPTGVLVMEFPYLKDFIDKREFDTCFTSGHFINGCNKNIEDCVIGDTCISANGEHDEITHVFKRKYTGELVSLKADYISRIRCTPEHPILVSRDNGKSTSWILASSLKEKDLLCIPKIPITGGGHQVIDLKKYNKLGSNWRRGLLSIKITEDFAYLAGAYTANGSCSQDTISIALGRNRSQDKKESLLRSIESLGCKCRVYDRTKYNSKCDNYNFTCTSVLRLFSAEIGRGSVVKKVPVFILSSNKKIIKAYLKGLFDGDGYYANGQLHLHTSSKVLAYQVQSLCASNGLVMGMSYNKPGDYNIRGKTGKTAGDYQLRGKSMAIREFVGDALYSKSSNRRYFEDEKYIYVSLKEVVVEKYSGMVYNLETKSNTYSLNNISVHNCYFEHLSYFSIKPLVKLCNSIGLNVMKVEKQDIHGGSVRVHIGYGEHDDSVRQFILKEYELTMDSYKQFASDAYYEINNFRESITALKESGKRIAAFAASAKGNTLLNCAGVNFKLIDRIYDETKEKQGKFYPGTMIEIWSLKEMNYYHTDYIVILSWNFAESIMKKCRDAGFDGKFIIPIPKFTVIE